MKENSTYRKGGGKIGQDLGTHPQKKSSNSKGFCKNRHGIEPVDRTVVLKNNLFKRDKERIIYKGLRPPSTNGGIKGRNNLEKKRPKGKGVDFGSARLQGQKKIGHRPASGQKEKGFVRYHSSNHWKQQRKFRKKDPDPQR